MNRTRKVFGLFAILAAAGTAAVGVLAASPAAAITSDTLGCYVTPSQTQPFLRADGCFNNSMYSTTYTATFQVASPTQSYTYAWSVPSAYVSRITAGCTASSSVCNIGGLRATSVVTVSVTLNLNGTAVSTQSVTADIEPWCTPSQWCG
jgi:hypothetical protein